MPIYEYQCRDCHQEFELLILSRERADDVQCGTCGGSNVERKVSSVGCCTSGSSIDGSVSAPGCGTSGFS